MQAPSSRIGRDGIAGPLNPYVHDPPSPLVGKEDEIPGYVTRFGAYHTLTEGVFLPAGTLLPQGCSFAMQATIDFGLHFPKGTKVPGGFLLPVSVVRKEEKIPAAVQKMKENPVCLVQ